MNIETSYHTVFKTDDLPDFHKIIERNEPISPFVKLLDKDADFIEIERRTTLFKYKDSTFYLLKNISFDTFSLISFRPSSIQRVDKCPELVVDTKVERPFFGPKASIFIQSELQKDILTVEIDMQNDTPFSDLTIISECTDPSDIRRKVKRYLGITLTDNPVENIENVLAKMGQLLHRCTVPTQLPL
jgi:hypothetical protein